MVHFDAPYGSPAHHAASNSASLRPPPAPAHLHQQPSHSNISAANQLSASRVDLEVQVLNHCFDDIERFVSRVLADAEAIREIEKRHLKYKNKSLKSKKLKILSDEMSALRAQIPQTQSFVDILQKFKLSFNLLARLKSHIHDPSAPELVHHLFEPLGLILNAMGKEYVWLMDTTAATAEVPEPPTNAATTLSATVSEAASLKSLPKTVWLPMLNRDAKELLFNCLNSKEQELWVN